MKTIQGALAAILLSLAFMSQAQNTLQFTATRATDEGAIRLEWASQSNHVYQIQCTDALNTNDDGTTTWSLLYDNYPSQGTDTFWLDTGNYFISPAIVHPSKSPMRFYRILDKGPDDLVGDEPTVTIISPTNGSVESGLLTVSVSASTDQGAVYHKLYVDGQEMWLSKDGSNYVINTCEWGNGPHVLFATADSSTAIDGPANSVGFVGHAVSPFVPVLFSNLVTRISFSQQFFEPSLGQTQQVSAVFAANSDWTLQIEDAYSNVVRTVTGNGTSMSFAWDGTGEGGTNIPNGVYYYYISAETNSPPAGGMAIGSMMPTVDNSTQLWVMPSDGSDNVLPLKIFPPGMDTNNLEIIAASEAQIQSILNLVSTSSEIGEAIETPAAFPSATPSSQASPPAPLRPPNPPCRGSLGKIAIAWQMYNANGTNPVPCAPISDGSGITGKNVQIEGNQADVSLPFAPFRKADLAAINFVTEMQKGCWDLGPIKNDNDLHISDLQGSGSFLNSADIAVIFLHGVYGTSSDSTPGHAIKGIYFPIASGGSAHYLRMSDMSLGGSSPTNGLKWLGLATCTGLYQQSWNSMKSQGVKPYNGNMHMICGATTDIADEPLIAQFWADNMLGDPTVGRKPMAIRDAWYTAGTQAYAIGITNGMSSFYPNPTTYAVAADGNCTEDTLQTNSIPTGTGVWSYYNTQTVFPQ